MMNEEAQYAFSIWDSLGDTDKAEAKYMCKRKLMLSLRPGTITFVAIIQRCNVCLKKACKSSHPQPRPVLHPSLLPRLIHHHLS